MSVTSGTPRLDADVVAAQARYALGQFLGRDPTVDDVKAAGAGASHVAVMAGKAHAAGVLNAVDLAKVSATCDASMAVWTVLQEQIEAEERGRGRLPG